MGGHRAAITGLYMLLQAILAYQEGTGALVFDVLAFVFLALVVPVYRGSEQAELVVVVTFVLLMLLFPSLGFWAFLPWQAIMAVMLWVGVRGGFTQGERWPRRAGQRR